MQCTGHKALKYKSNASPKLCQDPVTDPGKRSKRGRLVLVREGEGWATVREEERGPREDQLVTVFRDGEMLREWTWDEVTARAASH